MQGMALTVPIPGHHMQTALVACGLYTSRPSLHATLAHREHRTTKSSGCSAAT